MQTKFLPGLVVGCCVVLALTKSAIAGVAPKGPTDAEILGIYIQVNGFDVETALLGRAQASAPAVRDLAASVATDHLSVRQAALDLAAKCRVSPVLPINREAAAIEHDKAMTTLSGLKGADFDRAYLQHEIAFHRSAIDAVRQVLQPAATCPAIRAHFTDILPAFEHHLSLTEGLARELAPR